MKHFKVESEGHVQTWTMSNPPMNYMTAAMSQELTELIGKAEADENAPRDHSDRRHRGQIHHALQRRRAGAEGAADPAECARTFPALEAGFHRMLDRIMLMPKVVIAAINGDCMGGGYELALACDFRLAADGAVSNRTARSGARNPARRRRHAAPAAAHREGQGARGDAVRQRLSSARGRADGHGQSRARAGDADVVRDGMGAHAGQAAAALDRRDQARGVPGRRS